MNELAMQVYMTKDGEIILLSSAYEIKGELEMLAQVIDNKLLVLRARVDQFQSLLDQLIWLGTL